MPSPDGSISYILPFKEGGSLIELGGGEYPKIRPNVDARSLPTVDIVANLQERFPIEDQLYDGVYSKFLIEHITHRKVKQFISEVYRILKPDGYAVIITANLKAQAEFIASKPRWDGSESGMIFAVQDHEYNVHKCGFSPEYAIRLFKQAGFDKVKILPFVWSASPEHGPIEMIIEAHKP